MRKLQLTNPGYEYLEKGFSEWLDVLGYCGQGVYNMANIVREFLHHLEGLHVPNIKALEQKHIKSYHHYISSRTNQRRGGGLSDKSVLMHLQAIAKFLEYLHHKGVEPLPALGMRLPRTEKKEVTVLTPAEVKLLFEAAGRETESLKQEAINARDKAMLVIYYSCGLRRNEGVHVALDDINFDTRVLHVRKGKNYKERLVPFNKASGKYLEEYIYGHRPQLTKGKTESSLFIGITGKAMSGGTLYTRLKMLQLLTEDINLQQKTIGLHTLRHSIATHLLQAGMSLEKISRFLGHSSLDSTQIYTHLAEKAEI
jgi:integrase/recombinase XerD